MHSELSFSQACAMYKNSPPCNLDSWFPANQKSIPIHAYHHRGMPISYRWLAPRQFPPSFASGDFDSWWLKSKTYHYHQSVGGTREEKQASKVTCPWMSTAPWGSFVSSSQWDAVAPCNNLDKGTHAGASSSGTRRPPEQAGFVHPRYDQACGQWPRTSTGVFGEHQKAAQNRPAINLFHLNFLLHTIVPLRLPFSLALRDIPRE